MSTEARTTTNQANAQFSTGPRTPEGKARSSQNALKHGLSARQLAIQPVDQEEFDELLAEYQAQINPRGAAQQSLFDELVTAAWNLRRVRKLQAVVEMLDPQFDRLARHHSRFERTFHRSLNALKALQTDDAIRATLPIRVGAKTPILANPLIIAKRSHERDQQHRQRNADRVRNQPQTTAA